MKISRLTLYNFKSFEGKHVIDGLSDNLTSEKPVILIGGKNGAGKTTFFESILLCLYGKWNESVLWPSSGRKNESYVNYISSVVNNRAKRRFQTDMWVQIDLVEAEFGGVQHSMSIKRSWRIEQGKTEEVGVEIIENGQPINYIESDYEDFIRNELIPQEISQFFFFDGEKIQDFIRDEDKTFGESLESALGIGLYKKLQRDLQTTRRNIWTEHKANEDVKIKLHEVDGVIMGLQKEIGNHQDKIIELQEKIQQVSEEISDIELETNRITNLDAQTKEDYRREKERLDEQKGALQREIFQTIEDQIPLIMMANLGQQLKSQLSNEQELKQVTAAYDAAQAEIKPIVVEVFFEGNDSVPSISIAQKKFYAEKLWYILQRRYSVQKPPKEIKVIHDLTQPQIEAISQRLNITQGILERLTKNLHTLQNIDERRKQISSDEQRALSDEAKRLYHEGGRLSEAKEAMEGVIEVHRKKILELERQIETKSGEYTKLEKTAKKTDAMQRQIDYCDKLCAAIGVFSEQLKKRQVQLLEQYTHEMWKLLARKQDLISKIEINPDKRFSISLYDAENILLDKTKLSAGEKELLAISLIWGLSRLTNRSLPIVIDTPLGRLDADHRAHIAANYFKNASHQVILLSTDKEIVEQEYKAVLPHVSKHYLIEKNDGESSKVIPGRYFTNHVN